MGEWPGWVIPAIIGGSVLALLIRYFLFRIGCILADLHDPSVGKSVLVVLLVLAVTAPLGWWAGIWLLSLESKLSAPVFYPGLTVYAILAWVATASCYWLILAATYKKSLIIAGVELLLSALLIALVAGLVMVGLAGWQISRRGPAQSELTPRPAVSPAACSPCGLGKRSFRDVCLNDV